MRYLVVDDDEAFRGRLVRVLERDGATVESVGSVEETRQLAFATPPERIILDLRMPGESGLALIPWLKERYPAVPILVLTGFGSIATTQSALKLGASFYLTKPCSLQQILAAFAEDPQPLREVPRPTLAQVEWEHLNRVLADCGGNVSQSAKVLGMDRRSLQRRLARPPKLT